MINRIFLKSLLVVALITTIFLIHQTETRALTIPYLDSLYNNYKVVITLQDDHSDHFKVGETASQRKIEVKKDYNCSNPLISADRDKLGQVFLNLFQNAMDAMPSGGTLTISCEESTVPASLKPAILVKVQDSGIGIKKEHLGRIFDPFFSQKKKGTGLGLAVSHQIIKNHGGMIQVESEEGQGTVFYVYLLR